MKDDRKNNDLLCAIAIIIIAFIIVYVGYIVYKSNKELNSNSILNSVIDIIENNDISNEIDDNVLAKKEIVYEDVEIANYTTTLYDNEESRIYNIKKACDLLDNTIVKPNEEFSFNNTIGPMGEENGFMKATGFDSNGKFIQISGGGMCQISSTLYNAALLCNLEITERHAHSRRVAYVPIDKDATILYPTLDFKFINNTKDDIKIHAECDNYNVTIKLYKKQQSN